VKNGRLEGLDKIRLGINKDWVSIKN
jgi:hypothetical protein